MTGDLNAMIGACAIGERRMLEVVERYGFDAVLAAVRWLLDYSERRVRATIADWPDGDYRGRAVADSDFAGNRDINIDCTIRVRGEGLEVDFAGDTSAGDRPRQQHVRQHGVVGLYGVERDHVRRPRQLRLFRPIALTIPEGTIVNPISPAPVCTNTILIGSNIGDAVMKALESIVPENVGSVACDVMITMHYGYDSRFADRPYFVTATT